VGLPAQVADELLRQATLLGTTRGDLLAGIASEYLRALRDARLATRRRARKLDADRGTGPL
jgi:hypothetical protein